MKNNKKSVLLNKANVLAAVQHYANTHPSDISDHLLAIAQETITIQPTLIVELGVRSGESTFALAQVAQYVSSALLSVDHVNCDSVCSYSEWTFVQADSVQFAKRFPQWCQEYWGATRSSDERNPIDIDVWMLDTCHQPEMTRREILAWLPFVRQGGIMIFHDTNKPDRGVIQAIEKHLLEVALGTLDEKAAFVRGFQTSTGYYVVKHYPHSYGLAIIHRISKRS